MALMICPGCGKQFSDELSVCPGCDCSLKDIDSSVNLILAGTQAGPDDASPPAADETGSAEVYTPAASPLYDRQKPTAAEIISCFIVGIFIATILYGDYEMKLYRTRPDVSHAEFAARTLRQNVEIPPFEPAGGIARYFNAVTLFALPAIMFFCLSMCSYLRMKSPFYKIISVTLAALAVYFLADANCSYLITKEEAVGLKIISYVFGGFCFTHLFYILERKIERL
jgi:hypothetical protein